MCECLRTILLSCYVFKCFLICSMLIPGNVAGVAKQFLRCMFHQLAPNGILPQLFQSNIKGRLRQTSTSLSFCIDANVSVQWLCRKMLKCLYSSFCWNLLFHSSSSSSSPSLLSDGSFLRTLASSLIDFNELSSVAALNMLLEVGYFFFFLPGS